MTKRTLGRYGDLPPSASQGGERRGAPLPLVTQPMVPLHEQSDGIDPSVTRVDNPLSALKPETAAVLFGTKTQAMPSQAKPGAAAPNATPPEIGLTQHALPDEQLDRRLALVIDPDCERSAQFRVLRHHLLDLGRPQCVIVSSPQPGDGKTTTALNLALALSECGRAKVLLVETHLRRPQLANIFKFVPPWCFAEQLAAHRHQPMLPWSLIEIPQLWLHVGAVNPRIEKTQLLDGPAFAIAIERLRMAGYDHIVVDAPPVLGSADVNLMADAADAVILALRSKRSTTRDLRKSIDQLGGTKVAGTVLLEG
ncbi:MAG TPA: CpsD/CapB family tyrosine-protein kinase [Kofleriaceae bacterium]|nr:CpsD/CapB family tyrosine-protein kinase [Kofleriaceae bacterium]